MVPVAPVQFLEQFRRFDDGRVRQAGILADAHQIRLAMLDAYPKAL